MNHKRKFPHHMLGEIHEQPRTVRDTLAGRLDVESGTVVREAFPLKASEMKSLAWIQVAASGTSRQAGLFSKYVIEELAGIPVSVGYASELECHRSSLIPPLTIFISQSGETAKPWPLSVRLSGRFKNLGDLQRRRFFHDARG